MIKITWTGKALEIATTPRNGSGELSYPDIERLCNKLKSRGFEIQHTGYGWRRLAIPVNPKYGDPRQTMQAGQSFEYNK
jgi:hypothetical protein